MTAPDAMFRDGALAIGSLPSRTTMLLSQSASPQRDDHDHPDHQPVRVVTLIRPPSLFRNHMVLDTVSTTPETTVGSQLSATVSEGISEQVNE